MSVSSARSKNVGMVLNQTLSSVVVLNAQPAGMESLLTKIAVALSALKKFAGTVQLASKKTIVSALTVLCQALTFCAGTEKKDRVTMAACAPMNLLSALLAPALVATIETRKTARVPSTLIAELMHHADLATNSMKRTANANQLT